MESIINRDPDILSGMPVFRGTRVPIKNYFDYLHSGKTMEEFLDDFESVDRELLEKFLAEVMDTLKVA